LKDNNTPFIKGLALRLERFKRLLAEATPDTRKHTVLLGIVAGQEKQLDDIMNIKD